MLILELQSLAASIYGQIAEAHLDRLPDERTEAAAALASRLAPWNPSLVALEGWVLAESGEGDRAEAAYARALSWAPGDPLFWNEYALALARGDVFDGRLIAATRQALALAPTSPAVRESIAAMGLAYWLRGAPELRELWRQSMRWELDHNRESFLRTLEQRGDRIAFCLRHAADLGEASWCRGSPQ